MSVLKSFDASHAEMIHDAQVDFYGKRVATCSSDKNIHVHSLQDDQKSVLKGHDAPVWCLQWAHPRHGTVLISGSYDTRVIVWREMDGKWEQLFSYKHSGSVNSLAVSSAEDLVFCSGSSDGKVIEYQWDTKTSAFVQSTEFEAHRGGCFAVDYSPDGRIVSGGADNAVKVWNKSGQTYQMESQLDGHTDWVRDVAWSPLQQGLIASCGSDKNVFIWNNEDGQWKRSAVKKTPFADIVWKVSFSSAGGYLLGVSCGDGKVYLFRMTLDSDGNQLWESVGEVEEGGVRGQSPVANSPQQQRPVTQGAH